MSLLTAQNSLVQNDYSPDPDRLLRNTTNPTGLLPKRSHQLFRGPITRFCGPIPNATANSDLLLQRNFGTRARRISGIQGRPNAFAEPSTAHVFNAVSA